MIFLRTNDAGVYPIEGYWGETKAWRVEINRRIVELSGERELDPKDVLHDLFEELRADDPEWLAEQVQRPLRRRRLFDYADG